MVAVPANTIIEVLATGAGLLYIMLLIRERVSCWPFGIAGSLLSIYLFIDTRLYSEAILYAFYVGMGVWGWARWSARASAGSHPVARLSAVGNGALIAVSVAFGLTLGHLLATFTDAERPLIDAMTTSFSFAATFLEVRKTLDAWVYWMGYQRRDDLALSGPRPRHLRRVDGHLHRAERRRLHSLAAGLSKPAARLLVLLILLGQRPSGLQLICRRALIGDPNAHLRVRLAQLPGNPTPVRTKQAFPAVP